MIQILNMRVLIRKLIHADLKVCELLGTPNKTISSKYSYRVVFNDYRK